MTLEAGIVPISATERIGPGLTEAAFRASPRGAGAREFVRNDPHRSYVLKPISFEGRDWIAVVYFTDGRLMRASLSRITDRTWLTVDPEYEQQWTAALKPEMETRLQRKLPATFPWGEISVAFDQHTMSGSLIFSYFGR